MKKAILGVAVSMIVSVSGLASAQEAPPIDCGPGDGRESLTTEGIQLEFDAPSTFGHSAMADNDETGTVRANQSATFPFRANFAPHTGGILKVTLDWANNPHDYDLYVLDANGDEIASSENFNQTDPPHEELTIDFRHCDNFTIQARSWVAGPTETLTIGVTVEPGQELLACAENDPAPGCAGKLAGEAPDFVPDDRARLYFGGDRPGNVAATARYANSQTGQSIPMAQTLSDARPTSGVANTHTRPVVGNPDFGEDNNFFPFFVKTLSEPVMVSGPVHMLAWVSSKTMTATDVLWFDLMVDGGLMQRIEVAGKAGPGPKPVLVTFDGYDAIEAFEKITVGITSPRGNDDPPNQASYAEWTLFYDSVQYQSRVTLPFSLPAAA